MKDKKSLDLSRRKVLGGLGTIGLASAGAGLGTSAYLNDTESFTDNQLVAGTLDLKIDWQQLYYGPTESWEYVNAHPDHDDDGEQSLETDGTTVRYSDNNANIIGALTCQNLTHDYDFGEGQESLVDLSDVKPGDEGEITFSLHLCDNPGYIWLTADNFSEDGGVTTEPENESMDTGMTDAGELAENTFVEIWYDSNCNNKLDGGQTESDEVDVMIVLDRSGSMNDDTGSDSNSDKWANVKQGAKDLIEALGPGAEVGLVSYESSATVDEPIGTSESQLDTTIDGLSTGGGTDIAEAINTADAEFANSGRSTARNVMVVLTNGEPTSGGDPVVAADTAKTGGTTIYGIAYGSGANENVIEDISSPPKQDDGVIDGNDEFAFLATTTDITATFDDIGEQISGGTEQLILGKGDGAHTDHVSLAQAMDIMQRNDGRVPLDGDGSMGYGAGATSPERDCFEAGTSHCIGVHWWVPTSVGNAIQDDSLSFDLGFYAEQCRHNDGSGPTTTTQT